MLRINTAIGLVSAAIIAFQLVLMQILSYVQWYHFAYMIISVALLGFGAAGTFLSIFRKRLQEHYEKIFSLLLLITAILIPLVVMIANSKTVRFDSLLMFHDLRYTGRLLATYLIFFLPFFTGALAIGMSFVKFAGKIGKVYFANLLGSGLGGIIALLLMHWLRLEQLPVFVALLALLGGFVSISGKSGKLVYYTAMASMFILLLLFFSPFTLKPSEYKDIRKTILLPEANIELEENSPHGLLQVLSSPVLRYAPGVSLSYKETFPVRKVVFNNGNWCGYLMPANDTSKKNILNYTPQSLAYHIEEIEDVLILNAGTGENVSLALSHNTPTIVANEAHSGIFDLLSDSFSGCTNVRLHKTMARNLLLSDSSDYDLIQLPVIGSFFGNSGLNAVEVRYELTIEALHEMWDKLSDKGMICLSCWMDQPVRNAYRLLAGTRLLLDEKNIFQAQKHIIAIRSWSALTFLVSKQAFTEDQINKTVAFCNKMMFDPLLLPGVKNLKREKYNLLQNQTFFTNVDWLLSAVNNTVVNDYPYKINPVTDNRPFFFQNIRLSKLPELLALLGEGRLLFVELGYLLVLFTFIQMLVIAAVLIIFPLFVRSWKSPDKGRIFVYFSGIGLAYMFIEIVFIQQFTFYFGQAIYATAASICILLIASALGSYYSAFLRISRKTIFFLYFVIAVLLLMHALFLSSVLSYTIAQSMPVKTLLAIIIIGITGFFLGMPFPLGIKYLSAGRQKDIPWAWAFNGYFSVISTALATIISVEAGFFWVIVAAAMIYVIAGLLPAGSRQV